jgi:cobalt-zinc-cadmium efflux system outer membrane protein
MLKQVSLWVGVNACLFLSSLAVADPPVSPDPVLSRWVKQVLADNPQVQAANAAVEAASSRERAASRPLFNPELELDAETAETNSAFVGLGQTIDWADKRGARTAVAGYEREAAEAELANIRQMLASELLLALSDYLSALEFRRLSNRRVEIMDRFAHIAERRRKVGDLGQVELDLARLADAEAGLRQARAAAAQADAQRQLAAVLGEVPTQPPALSSQLPKLQPETIPIETLLNELPELRVQRLQIAANRAMVELHARERRPDPTLELRAGREEFDPLVGITLSVPLFLRNSFQAEVDVANADLIQAQQQGLDMHRRAKARLISAAKRYALMRDAWSQWEQAGQVSLERQVELLQRLWQAGELSTTDYLVQLKQSLDTRTSAVDLRGELWRSWFEWLAASGQVDGWLGLFR